MGRKPYAGLPISLDLNIPNTTVGKDSVLRRLDAWWLDALGGHWAVKAAEWAPPRVTWIWSGVFGVEPGAGATSGSEVGISKMAPLDGDIRAPKDTDCRGRACQS